MLNWPNQFSNADLVDLQTIVEGKPDCRWALEVMIAKAQTEFQFPPDFVLNKRDSYKKRRVREAKFRDQWDEALDLYWTHFVPWHCSKCILSKGAKLIGRRIRVFWLDDGQSYGGIIDAYDKVSRCHRVLYDDRKWEFISLSVEPVLLLLKD